MDAPPSAMKAAAAWLAEYRGIVEAVVGATVGTFAVAKGIIPAIKAIARIVRLLERIEELCRELEPDHGSSIKDAIHRIEARVLFIEARDDALLSDHTLGIFICGADGKNIYSNRTYGRMLGASPEDLHGFGWRNFIAPDELDRYDEKWREAFSEDREIVVDLEFTRRDGAKVKTVVQTHILRGADGGLLGFLGMVRIPDPVLCSGPSGCPSRVPLT